MTRFRRSYWSWKTIERARRWRAGAPPGPVTCGATLGHIWTRGRTYEQPHIDGQARRLSPVSSSASSVPSLSPVSNSSFSNSTSSSNTVSSTLKRAAPRAQLVDARPLGALAGASQVSRGLQPGACGCTLGKESIRARVADVPAGAVRARVSAVDVLNRFFHHRHLEHRAFTASDNG